MLTIEQLKQVERWLKEAKLTVWGEADSTERSIDAALSLIRSAQAAPDAGVQQPVDKPWIVVRQTVLDDIPGMRPQLGYTVWEDHAAEHSFSTADEASAFIKANKLPLGWVRMQKDQSPWNRLFRVAASPPPQPAVQAQAADTHKSRFNTPDFLAALERTIEARNVSARDLSEATGVSDTSLSRMRSGERMPDAASFAALCAWAGLNPMTFMTPLVQPQPEPAPGGGDALLLQAEKVLLRALDWLPSTAVTAGVQNDMQSVLDSLRSHLKRAVIAAEVVRELVDAENVMSERMGWVPSSQEYRSARARVDAAWAKARALRDGAK